MNCLSIFSPAHISTVPKPCHLVYRFVYRTQPRLQYSPPSAGPPAAAPGRAPAPRGSPAKPLSLSTHYPAQVRSRASDHGYTRKYYRKSFSRSSFFRLLSGLVHESSTVICHRFYRDHSRNERDEREKELTAFLLFRMSLAILCLSLSTSSVSGGFASHSAMMASSRASCESELFHFRD